jgi:hypothetical protein
MPSPYTQPSPYAAGNMSMMQQQQANYNNQQQQNYNTQMPPTPQQLMHEQYRLTVDTHRGDGMCLYLCTLF